MLFNIISTLRSLRWDAEIGENKVAQFHYYQFDPLPFLNSYSIRRIMKTSINRALVGTDAVASLLLVFGIFFLVGFACNRGKSADSKPIPSEYFGAWTGEDG